MERGEREGERGADLEVPRVYTRQRVLTTTKTLNLTSAGLYVA